MKPSTYKAGELDQRVAFLRESKTDDGMGGSIVSWTEIVEVWAKVRPMSGTEREHSDRLNAQANYLIVIRYRSDITESDVAEWKGQRFNIRFSKDEPRSTFLALEAELGVAV
jgi:SPP1 family predicted phage head-tail adaptor